MKREQGVIHQATLYIRQIIQNAVAALLLIITIVVFAESLVMKTEAEWTGLPNIEKAQDNTHQEEWNQQITRSAAVVFLLIHIAAVFVDLNAMKTEVQLRTGRKYIKKEPEHTHWGSTLKQIILNVAAVSKQIIMNARNAGVLAILRDNQFSG